MPTRRHRGYGKNTAGIPSPITLKLLNSKTLYLVSPRGWCAGVERAIGILEAALKQRRLPIYVRREIVHNKTVVATYKKRGIVFVNEVSEAPSDHTVIFSAHGITPMVWQEAKKRRLDIIDATCPLVTKVHLEVKRYVQEGFHVIYVGHKNHEEAVGVLGEAPDKIHVIENESEARTFSPPNNKLIVLTQTTLSLDDTKRIIEALKKRFPQLKEPPKDDICYATQNRQNAIRTLIQNNPIDLLYVIGSKNSSNSNRLCEVAQGLGVKAKLIDTSGDIDLRDWQKCLNIALTSGASAPEFLIEEVVQYFKKQGFKTEEVVTHKEDVAFALPRELREIATSQALII